MVRSASMSEAAWGFAAPGAIPTCRRPPSFAERGPLGLVPARNAGGSNRTARGHRIRVPSRSKPAAARTMASYRPPEADRPGWAHCREGLDVEVRPQQQQLVATAHRRGAHSGTGGKGKPRLGRIGGFRIKGRLEPQPGMALRRWSAHGVVGFPGLCGCGRRGQPSGRAGRARFPW